MEYIVKFIIWFLFFSGMVSMLVLGAIGISDCYGVTMENNILPFAHSIEPGGWIAMTVIGGLFFWA